MKEKVFLSVFEGVPKYEVPFKKLESGLVLSSLLTEETSVFSSKGELRRLISGGGLSLNKKKVSDMNMHIDESQLLNKRYILVQKGKKNYFLILAAS